MKKLCFMFVLIPLLFSLSLDVFAVTDEYNESFSLIGADKLSEIIDDNAKNFFDSYDIDVSDYSWVNKLTANNIFGEILNLFKSGIKKPFKSGVSLIVIIILTAMITSLDVNNNTKKTLMLACILSASLIIVSSVWSCISASVSAIKYISGFMMSFIPVFVLAVSLSGATLSGSASGGLLILSSEAISYFASNFALPIMGGYLSLSLVSSISPFNSLLEFAQTVKKSVFWMLSLIFTVFVGIVGIQTTVNGAADSLGLKTTKFIIGTCVPIVGDALSESANTIYASMNLLKSSVGIYGVVVVAIAVIPMLIEILLWKIMLAVSVSLSKTFGEDSLSLFLKAIDSIFSVLIAILLFSAGLFIVSLSVVVTVAKI